MEIELGSKMAAINEKMIPHNDILIVDDEVANLKLLAQLLAQQGYQVRPAERPQLAIDSARAQPPALILLDVKMPKMDGFEVCRRLKQDERTHDIPIIFISALQDVLDRVRGFNAGGVDFITKPIQEDEVLARVRTHMDLHSLKRNLEEMVAIRTAELESEILERRQAEKKLANSEAKYRGLVENSIVGVFASTIEGSMTFVNDAMARMFDFDNPEEMMAHRTPELWADPGDRSLFVAEMKKRARVTNFEAVTLSHTGRRIDVLFSARQVGNDILGMVMDITERKQAEQKLLDYQQRLKAMASQLALVEEKERRRIAVDLHDHVGQSLALARIQLASARNSAAEPMFADQLESISDTLLEALEDTQQLMLELSSSALSESGLSAAISEWLELRIGSRHGIKTEFIDNFSDVPGKKLDPNVKAIIFRNVRELLINIVKHARAKKITVRLEDRGKVMRIIVEDDGMGFDPSVVTQTWGKTGGFGLFSIKELMADLSGSLRIVSQPGKGCTAILSVPFGNDDNQEKS
jgi:PAS domain S-box-containing protein